MMSDEEKKKKKRRREERREVNRKLKTGDVKAVALGQTFLSFSFLLLLFPILLLRLLAFSRLLSANTQGRSVGCFLWDTP